jgi:PmbA protein
MKEQNLKALAEQLVAYGTKKGASQVQISVSEGNEFNAEIRNGNIERLTEAGSKGIGMKILVDNKTATASSSDFAEDTLHRLIDNAITRAKLASTDEFAGLPEKQDITVDIDKLKMYDPGILEIKPETKIKFAKDLEGIALADKRIKQSNGSSFGTSHGESFLANSNGFSGSFKYTNCWAGVGLQVGTGDNDYQDGWWESGVSFKQLPTPEEIANIALKRTIRMLGARKIETQNLPVVLEPEMTGRILRFLSSCIYGRSIYMNQSLFAGKLGEKIGNDNITIYDDPTIPAGPGSRPFDGEGVPCVKKTVIENGVLKSYLLDTYSGRKLKMKSTGNYSGTANFYLVAGKHSPEEIIKSVKKGLLLVSTLGQGTVPTTGDISTGAFGIMIENGELTYPVAEITISTNLAKLLKEVEMIGSDLKFNQSTTGPTIKVKEMTISGT